MISAAPVASDPRPPSPGCGRHDGPPETPRPVGRHRRAGALGTALALGALACGGGGPAVTTPTEELGYEIGADYVLANYTQLTAYWQKLATESPRMVLDTMGTTAEGRPQLMAIITSADNHTRLDRYREIAERLARADGLDEEEARELSREGKAVVWIDGGLHATEVLGAAQLMEMVYQLVSLEDEETQRFLDDTIVLLAHANPDGMELISDWYMRQPDTLQRSTGGIPRLYQKYVGHDNNRDSYLVSQPETENISRVMYREWYPQIMYNHHQSGPAGTVLFAPPFRDPPNHNVHPLVTLGIQAVGTAMHQRLVSEGKYGSTMREGANYSAWFNGNLRTTSYFHNIIGILTETIGNPTPSQIPLRTNRLVAFNDLPAPIMPQEWHFRQSVDYSVTNNRAILDYASRNRERVLFDRWQMGRDAIERGNSDTWTLRPKMVERLAAAGRGGGGRGGGAGRGGATAGVSAFDAVLRDPDLRDPRGYILPADQPDFPTAVKFVNTLVKNGVEIERVTEEFSVGGTSYPMGTLVIRTAQAYGPHVLDMFEPQDHPNDFQYDGGPPIPPYDNAGYTLALQMGVEFDRILEAFDGPFQPVPDLAQPEPGEVTGAANPTGYLVSHAPNDAAIVTNRLLREGQEVFWLTSAVNAGGQSWPVGTLWVTGAAGNAALMTRIAGELGIDFVGAASTPVSGALRLSPVRIGLWDRYGGSMPSGWTRWIFEQFEFSFELVYPPQIDAGGLGDRFDVLVFEDGAVPAGGGGGGRGGGAGGNVPADIPEEYRAQYGNMSGAVSVPNILAFARDGGTVVGVGSSARNLADHANLPVANHLVNAAGDPLQSDDYYVPSSVLEMRIDNTRPVAYGMGSSAMVMFSNSPVFTLLPGARAAGVLPVSWFDTDTPLRSGWAWGEQYLNGGVTGIEASVGNGRMYLFGPLIKKRAQPHGTFKLLFNALYLAGAEEVRLGG